MTSTSNNSSGIEALKGFYSSFTTINLYGSENLNLQKQNNINQVNILLDSLFKKQSSVDLATQTLFKSSSKTPLPSYNTRTPYVKLLINGLQFIPNINTWTDVERSAIANTIDSLILNDIEVEFQNLELTMPFGGVGSTITGTITLFSRDPIELISFINDYYQAAPTSDTSDSDPALPVVELAIGWSIGQESGNSFLISPNMEFLVMGMSMTDPGKGQGAEITLKIQDKGSAILANSSTNICITSDYPQQQLRTIIEGLLGLRLFTLDDLLYLNVSNAGKLSSIGYSDDTTSRTLIAQISKYVSTPASASDSSGFLKSEYEDILAGLRASLDPATANAVLSTNKDESKTIFQLATELKQAGISYSNILNAIESNRTFFVNEKNPVLRINNNTLKNSIESLVDRIQCRWYPISNNKLLSEIAEKPTTDTSLFNIKQKIAQATTEEEKKKSNLEFEQAVNKLSTSCVLVWVPTFPEGIDTTGSKNYEVDVTTPGAYLLLPKTLVDPTLNEVQLPLIYGPGGSSAPWFYAGGQNVLQTGLANNNLIPMAYGEVLDITMEHNNLLELMRLKIDETAMYAATGERWAATNQAKTNKVDIKAMRAKKIADLKLQAPNLINKVNENLKSQITAFKAFRVKFKPGRAIFGNTISPRIVIQGDNLSSTSISPRDRTNFNPTDIKTFAKDRLANRITLFLGYPTTIGMSILGDPFLLRQGIGAFELLNYFPSKDGKTMKLNFLSSGIYMPTTMTHSISTGEYITRINAIKCPYPVPGSLLRSLTTPTSSENSSSQSYLEAEQQLLASATLDLENQVLNLPALSSQEDAVTKDGLKYTKVNVASAVTQSQTSFLSNTIPAEMGTAFTESVADIYKKASLLNDTTKNKALTDFIASMKKTIKK